MGAVSFEVKQSALKEGSQDLRQYRNTLRTINMSVKEAKRVMSCMQGSITLVCGSLSKIESKINTCADKTSSMAGVLEEIAGFYGNTEAILTNSIKQGTMTSKEAQKYLAGHLGYIKIANTYHLESKLFYQKDNCIN